MEPKAYTAQEIADLCKEHGLALPHTKQAIARKLVKGGFDKAPFARRRVGVRGGALEYFVDQIDVLDDLKFRLRSIAIRQSALVENKSAQAVEKVRRQHLDATAFNARQREVMEARAAILSAIDACQLEHGETRTAAMARVAISPDQFSLTEDLLTKANDRSANAQLPSEVTLKRWFATRNKDGVVALAPARTKKAQDIPQWFWGFLSHYARPQKPCITEAMATYRQSAAAIDPLPSYDQIRRLIGKLGNVEKHRGREGSLTLKSRMAYVLRSTADLLPTCVYAADGKTFDAEVAHPDHGKAFRPEITSIVDVATRKCVGFSVALAENQFGTVDALRMACVDHGICAIFYVDNGAGFKNQVLDDQLTGMAARLGITKHHSLPYSSQARGIIERFNGTVWNPLSRLFDSYVGVDMDRQARMMNFKVTRKDLKEFGASRRLPTWQEFIEACRMAVADYNDKPHSSLPDKMSPNEYWAHHVERGFQPVSVEPLEADDLFRPYFKRRVRRCLIEWQTNKYFSNELAEYDGDDVLVGVDIADANRLWVRAIDATDDGDAPGRLICVAKFAGNETRYIPLTMERAANERRVRAQAKRLEDKMDVVASALRPAALLDQTGQRAFADMQDVTPRIDDIIPPANDAAPIIDGDSEPSRAKAMPKRQTFRTDAELALWAINHPEELSERQRSVLQMCLRSKPDRDLLEIEGIDLERLRTVLQAAA